MSLYEEINILPRVREMLRLRRLHRELRAKGYAGVECYKGSIHLLRLETACARAQLAKTRAAWGIV